MIPRISRDVSTRMGMAVIVCLAAAMLAGCGLFEPREPELPASAGSRFESPTSPTIVLRNLERSLLSANASDYRRCFSDSSKGLPLFRFNPSAQGLSMAPATFAEWGTDHEVRYISNAFAELETGELASVSFSPPDVTDPPFGDSVQFSTSYSLRLPHRRLGVDQLAQGRLQFTFRQSRQGEWYIATWRDIVVDNVTSWSVLKARFYDR